MFDTTQTGFFDKIILEPSIYTNSGQPLNLGYTIPEPAGHALLVIGKINKVTQINQDIIASVELNKFAHVSIVVASGRGNYPLAHFTSMDISSNIRQNSHVDNLAFEQVFPVYKQLIGKEAIFSLQLQSIPFKGSNAWISAYNQRVSCAQMLQLIQLLLHKQSVVVPLIPCTVYSGTTFVYE
jgi:hypothetical protein